MSLFGVLDWISIEFLGFLGLYRGCIGFYWVSLGFTGFYWISLGFTGFYGVSSDVSVFNAFLSNFFIKRISTVMAARIP